MLGHLNRLLERWRQQSKPESKPRADVYIHHDSRVYACVVSRFFVPQEFESPLDVERAINASLVDSLVEVIAVRIHPAYAAIQFSLPERAEDIDAAKAAIELSALDALGGMLNWQEPTKTYVENLDDIRTKAARLKLGSSFWLLGS